MKINTAIAELRKNVFTAVGTSELPPVITALVLSEILHVLNDAAEAQYKAEQKESDENKETQEDGR